MLGCCSLTTLCLNTRPLPPTPPLTPSSSNPLPSHTHTHEHCNLGTAIMHTGSLQSSILQSAYANCFVLENKQRREGRRVSLWAPHPLSLRIVHCRSFLLCTLPCSLLSTVGHVSGSESDTTDTKISPVLPETPQSGKTRNGCSLTDHPVL